MSVTQFRLNQEIKRFVLSQDEAGKSYSPDQIRYINQYTGSGGMASKGATGQGLLYEFYTPDYVCDLMWELARHYGYPDSGTVLEPSCATGRLFRGATDYSKCVGFEVNPVSARIAELTYPGVTVFSDYFETAFLVPPRYTNRVAAKIFSATEWTDWHNLALRRSGSARPEPKYTIEAGQKPTWLAQAPFDLVIGNPPYGIYQNEYSGYFPETRRQGLKQIEIFFMVKGLELLKPGGILVYLTGSNFMRNGVSYQTAKMYMDTLCVLKDAYRLPPVFDTSKVPTDILVFQRN